MTKSILAQPFLFTEEQQQFERIVSQLVRREFLESYLERATSDEMCWSALEALGRHGLVGMSLPVELGGQDADAVTRGIACEQVAYGDFNLSYFALTSELAGAVASGLPREISEPIVREVVAGRDMIAMALTEPRGGSDASGISLRATAVPGGYRLDGEKTSVTLGMHASYAIVVATTEPGGGSRSTKRFLVRLNDSTITRQRLIDPGFRPLSRASLFFDGTFVPEDHEMKAAGSGVAATLADFDLTRTLLGLMTIGAARRAIDMAVVWARDRETFGQPIAAYQGVSFTIAEHHTQLEAARWLCYRTLGLRDAGLPHTKEAAMCKWWAPRLAVRAINDCIVIHGHVGWSAEMPLQQMLLDVSGLQIGDGTPQVQKLVIARHLIGRKYVG